MRGINLKIKFMKDDAITYMKGNMESFSEYYLKESSEDIEKLCEEYLGESPFNEFKVEIQPFHLDMSANNPTETDYINVKILHSALKNISDTQAADERFWAGLAHTYCWDYVQYRSRVSENKMQVNKIKNSWYFNQGNKRSLAVNPLARLWWLGKAIYDETDIGCEYRGVEYLKQDFASSAILLLSNNYANNKKITRAILSAGVELRNIGYKIKRKEFNKILRYVNNLGGIIILDYLSEEELRNKIITYGKTNFVLR